jgi:sec-independent protein translocase protein TatA
MGFGGISIWSLILILVIVLLLFGTKRLKNVGSDLGGAIKGFRKAMKEGVVEKDEPDQLEKKEQENVIEGESTREKDKV